MMILASTSDIVRVVTGEAADIEPHASWLDMSGSTFTPGRTNTVSITTATTTTVVGSPGASTYRNAKLISLRNNHASQECNVTVEHFDGTAAETLIRCLLLPGETLVFSGSGVWRHYTANGEVYPATGSMATQAEMETGTSVVVVVTPGRQHFHPGHPKMWAKFGVTGNLLDSWNVDSVNDDGTGLATVTITADFSSVDWVCLLITERAATALTVANARDHALRSGGQAAGAITVEAWDHNAATPALADPTAYHIIGLGDR